MRHWFVTGTSSGFGRAIARAALERGDRVTGTVLNASECDAFEALAPGRAHAAVLDVSQAQDCERVVEVAGDIDFLVNNAGYSLEGVFEACSMDELRRLVDVHLFGPISLMKAALPNMRRRRSGFIINIASQAAHMPSAGISAYAAAKAGIEALSRSVAIEVEPFGIRVMVLVPGAFRTELGTSRQSASESIEDYTAADEARRAFFATFSGKQRGDPEKAAKILVDIVDLQSPPSVFALGIDAYRGLRDHALELMREANAWETRGADTDVDHGGDYV